jgi:hypothetical protein
VVNFDCGHHLFPLAFIGCQLPMSLRHDTEFIGRYSKYFSEDWEKILTGGKSKMPDTTGYYRTFENQT